MTKFMRLAVVATMVAAMGISSVGAFAAEVVTANTAGVQTFAQRASTTPLTGEALEAHQKDMLAAKKAILDARVKAGTMTQAEADAILKAIATNQLTCDGTGSAKIGQTMGAKFGSGGQGQGLGGSNKGQGMGRGMGQGRGQGTCVVTPTN